MPLTQHQTEKYNEALALLRSGYKRLLIKGSAGVGKTFFAGELVKALKHDRTLFSDRYNSGQIYVTAPTNKALAVLQTKVHTPVEFKTVHSALKMRRWIDRSTGKETFAPGYNSKNNEAFKAKAWIIDEASMLPTIMEGGYDEEGQYIRGYLESLGMPVIYIGDDKQINPVGEADSPVFKKNYAEIELTEIIRQGNDNPIIDLSRDLDMIFFKEPNVIDNKGYVYDNNKAGLIDSLAEVNGTDDMKYLAYTNNTVDDMNLLVRQRRYGNPNKLEKGETIVFNSPFGNFYTNKEEKIIDFDIIIADIPMPKHDTRFDSDNQPINATDTLRVKYYNVNGGAFLVIHEDSEQIFDKASKMIDYNCGKLGWDFRGKYFFKEQFADIKYNHALTVHKSQGSTYKQTILNIADIQINQKAYERTRLLYTGVTRASDLVILNNVK